MTQNLNLEGRVSYPMPQEDTYVLLDTGALITLYHKYGEDSLRDILGNGNCYVLTSAVRGELERQYHMKSTLSDDQCVQYGLPRRTPKVPYSLMNLVWTKVGEQTLLEEDVPLDDQAVHYLKQKMVEGSAATGNARIGSGDMSLIGLALCLLPSNVLIVSNDSDIPNTLSAIESKVQYVDEDRYARVCQLQAA